MAIFKESNYEEFLKNMLGNLNVLFNDEKRIITNKYSKCVDNKFYIQYIKNVVEYKKKLT